MHESREAFIDLALRPMMRPGAEKDLARGELMDRLAHAEPAAGDDSLEEARRRLEKRRPRPPWPAIVTGIVLLALLATALVLAFRQRTGDFQRIGRNQPWLSRITSTPVLSGKLGSAPDPALRRFLLRNSTEISVEQRREWILATFEEEGGDAALYEEWVLSELDYLQRIPANYEVSWQRIEPTNGLWRLLEGMAKGGWLSSPPTTDPVPAELKEALAAPTLRSHFTDLMARRIALISPSEDLHETAERIAYFERQRDPKIQDILNRWLVSKCEMEARIGNAARWREAAECFEQLWNRPEIRYDLHRSRVFQSYSFSIGRQARAFGFTDLTARLGRKSQRINSILGTVSKTQDPKWWEKAPQSLANDSTASLLAGFDEASLKPGRQAEHALIDGVTSLLAAALFTLLAIQTGLEAWRRPPEINRLATGLAPLWRASDWAWLIGIGLLLPLAWHALITRATPLGCRDLAPLGSWGAPALQQAGGTFLLAIVLLIQTGRWRWARRGGVIALRPQRLWVGVLIALVAAAFIPAIGCWRYLDTERTRFLQAAGSVAGIPLLWLLWHATALVLTPRSSALGGVLLCRKLCPAACFAALLLFGGSLHFKAEERRQVAQDEWSQADPSGRFPTRLEAAISDEITARMIAQDAADPSEPRPSP